MTDPFSPENIYELAQALEEPLLEQNTVEQKQVVKVKPSLLQVEPTGNTYLLGGEEELKITTLSDGTTTTARIYNDIGLLLGEGTSRRRKGDPRDTHLGVVLATARAFQSAAETFASLVEDNLKD